MHQPDRLLNDSKAAPDNSIDIQSHFKTILDTIIDGVISTDTEGRIHLFNGIAEYLTGWKQEDALGKPLDDVFNKIDETTREKMENPVRVLLAGGMMVELPRSAILVSKDGVARPIEDGVTPIKDQEGNIIGVVLVFRDITKRKAKDEEIVYLSYYDSLTGLYNRRFFEEELVRLDTERNLPITLVMADVDQLKLANDTYGHPLGDQLLIRVAEVMKSECRRDDIIARVGGDEFMFLLPKTDTDGAEVIINRINQVLIREKIDSITPSVSFGWASKHDLIELISSVAVKAESNMYKNKQKKQNLGTGL